MNLENNITLKIKYHSQNKEEILNYIKNYNNVVKFTEIKDNSCGGYAFNGIDYDDGAKLVVRAKTELGSFTIKPVKPDKEFVQTVTDHENFNDYTIELGTSDTLTQIGFISKVIGTVEIESIKIVYAD